MPRASKSTLITTRYQENHARLCCVTKERRKRIARILATKELTNPTTMIPAAGNATVPARRCHRETPVAPAMIGTARRKEKSRASLLVVWNRRAAEMVHPERERP